MARVKLVEKDGADTALKEIYQRSEDQGRPVLNLVKLLANCPRMASDYLRYGGSVLRGENVPMKLRELATLRVGAIAGADYEFLHHTPLGVSAGLTRRQIDEIANWPGSSLFDETERLVLGFTDQVAGDNRVTDETFAAMRAVFSEHDIVELTMVIAYFVMLCRILVTFQLELEPGFSPDA